jgi:large subunit ribosomal protein L18
MLKTTLAKKRTHARRRRWRIRKKVVGTAQRPRLAFHKSLRHLCAQVIDDTAGATLVHATTQAASFRQSGKRSFRNIETATALGAQLAQQAKEKGVTTVVFDRGGHRYHGVVKAFAEAVRQQGIRF